MTWQESAACRSVDPDLFYPDGTDNRGMWIDARRVCRACPVAGECLNAALTNNEAHGMWGGMTPAEREAIAPSRNVDLAARSDRIKMLRQRLRDDAAHRAAGLNTSRIAAGVGINVESYLKRLSVARRELESLGITA